LQIKLIILLFFLSFFGFFSSIAATSSINNTDDWQTKVFHKKRYNHYKKTKPDLKNIHKIILLKDTKEKTKGKVISMAILTGPIGGHRIYLGTTPFVPTVYAITLGGGMGLLPAVDLIAILLSKQLDNYENNPNIFMW